MKIYSEPFKKWIKVLETYASEKGDPIRESIYLNFKDNYCYFASREGIGKLKFYFEKELDDEDIPNFFINTSKFLNIISQYDEINLNSDFVFSNGKDKYKISIITDEEFDDSLINADFGGEEIEFTKDQVNQIVTASAYTNKDEQNIDYRNIFIKDKFICALTTPTPLYEAKFDSDVEAIVSLNVSKTLGVIGIISEGCFLVVKEGVANKKILSRDKELELIVSGSSSAEFPPNRTDKFIESYNYGTFVKVETVKFAKTLQSLRPYYNEVINTKISITFGDDMLIKVSDTQNEIEKHVEIQECDPSLVGKTIYISAQRLEMILGTLRGALLIMEVPEDENKPIINFYNDESQHILTTRFKS